MTWLLTDLRTQKLHIWLPISTPTTYRKDEASTREDGVSTESSTHLSSAWYESVERERRLCRQWEYRPIRRASTHAGSTDFLLSPQAEKHSRYLAQSPLVTLVDGEQSFGGGLFQCLERPQSMTQVLPLLPSM